MRAEKGTVYNIGLAIWRLKYFYETFVQGSTFEILLNFCTKNLPQRQALFVVPHITATQKQ